MRYGLCIEQIENRWVAHVPELPGCFAGAETLDDALAGAPDAIAAYRAWCERHGDPAIEEPFEVETREIHRAWDFEPDDEVNAFFAADRRALTIEEIGHALLVLEWTRADLLAAVADLSPEDLARPVEDDWSIEGILNHVGRAEAWYLDRLDLALPPQSLPEKWPARLERIRAHLRAVLPFLAGDERVVEARRELWSPRKLLRRAVWHERDHTDHIRQFRARLGV